MQKRDLAAYAILASALLCLLVCLAVRFFDLVSIFSTVDLSIACALFLAALAVGFFLSNNGLTNPSTAVLATAAIALGIGMFTTMFAVSGSELATLAAVWFSSFAAARVVLSAERWTRPGAIATISAFVFLLAFKDSFLATVKNLASQFSAWIASSLLDSVAVAHFYEKQSIKLLSGELNFDVLSNAWFGVLPVVGLVALISVSQRCSLIQSILVGLSAICTWSCMEGVYAWWNAWSGSSSLDVAGLGILWNLAMLLFVVLNAFLIIALTEPIPLEREDLDYPVSTYFWNFLTRFPTSLTSDPLPRHQ